MTVAILRRVRLSTTASSRRGPQKGHRTQSLYADPLTRGFFYGAVGRTPCENKGPSARVEEQDRASKPARPALTLGTGTNGLLQKDRASSPRYGHPEIEHVWKRLMLEVRAWLAYSHEPA